MGKTVEFEGLAQLLEGKTWDQVREVTRELRRVALWPRDRSGGGMASQPVPVDAVANRMLSVGSANLPGIEAYVSDIGQTRFSGTQHGINDELPDSVARLLSAVAVDAGGRQFGFIRGADLTLHQTVAHMLVAISITPAIADVMDALKFELELISAPHPFGRCAVIWLHENGQRYGWTLQTRGKRAANGETPTRVLVRSAKIPALWFREYAALLVETPDQMRQEDAA